MLNWLKRIFKAASPENPSTNLAKPSEWLVDWAGGGVSDSGMVVTKLTSMRSSAVFRCVSILSGAVASLPWCVFKREGEEKKPTRTHYAYRLLHDEPNNLMASFMFRQLMMANLLLDGNFYAVIGFDNAGRAVELMPFPPEMVEVLRKGKTQAYAINTHEDGRVIIPASQMIHVSGIGFDGIKGLSVIGAVARQSVGLSLAMDVFASKIHANSARPSGAVEMDANLSPEAFKRLKQQFEQLYTGAYNSGKTVFLDNGMKWSPMQISPADAQTLESRRFQVADIARIFGVPPHLIGETDKSSSWGTGIEQMTLGFLTFTLNPWLVAIEQEFNRKLMGSNFFCEFQVEGLLRGDSASRAEFYASAIQNGWMKPNEVRHKENLPPADGGDRLFIQQNLMPLDKAGEAEPTGASNANPEQDPAPQPKQ